MIEGILGGAAAGLGGVLVEGWRQQEEVLRNEQHLAALGIRVLRDPNRAALQLRSLSQQNFPVSSRRCDYCRSVVDRKRCDSCGAPA